MREPALLRAYRRGQRRGFLQGVVLVTILHIFIEVIRLLA